MINFDNQELIHHIHCVGYILCHQSKTMKFCWFDKFLFYSLYFKLYSLNVSNIYYSTMHLYICYNLLLQQHFYSRLLLFYVHYWIDLWLQSEKFFNCNASSFIFHFSNDYNLGHNILRRFVVLPNFSFAASETDCDY